tara:strand:+ start:215 stop:688 length:474 start_codon:yes stop_codon:yes gene_type:complete
LSTKIRLSRGGTKKRPHYRIVVADTRSPRDGRFIERLGTYNPLLPKDDPKRVTLNSDRIKYWLNVGARPTDRVSRFLGMANITEMPEQKNNPIKAKPKAKAQERAAKLSEKNNSEEETKKNEPNKEEEVNEEKSNDSEELKTKEKSSDTSNKPEEKN